MGTTRISGNVLDYSTISRRMNECGARGMAITNKVMSCLGMGPQDNGETRANYTETAYNRYSTGNI